MYEIVIILFIIGVIVYVIKYNWPNYSFIIPRELNQMHRISIVVVGFRHPSVYLRRFFKKKVFTATTIVEPDPMKHKHIYSCLSNQPFNLICGAIVPRAESSTTLYISNAKCSLFYPPNHKNTDRTIKTRALTLQDLLKYHRSKSGTPPDVLILNVAGAEYDILKHWLTLRNRHWPSFVLFDRAELKTQNVQRFNTLMSLFEKQGYTLICHERVYLQKLCSKTSMVCFVKRKSSVTF